jgi:predicted RNase H-like nuclease (RuvC/YqgF family)
MNRKYCIAGACLLAGIVALSSQAPLAGQGKKDDQAKQIQNLQKMLANKEQQINKLEQQNNKLDLQIAKLKLDYDYYKKTHPTQAKLQKDLDAANQTIKDRDATIASLQKKSPTAVADLTKENSALRKQIRDLQAIQKAPFVHTVILKLKSMDDDKVKKVQEEVAKTLAKISGVRSIYVGKPAEKGTPEFAQKEYQLGVVVLLDDADSLQKFLDDSLHKQFMDKMGDYWERPVVYDFQRDDAK